MGWIEESVASIKSFKIRQALHQAVSLGFFLLTLSLSSPSLAFISTRISFFGMIVASALMIWKTLMCVTGSESPVVVVLSESMEPGFSRGDILFLYLSRDPIRVGEIVVYNIDGRDIPIVHRVIKVHERKDTGEVDILTKGDNNEGDDIPLYAPDQYWLQRHHIMGRAVGFLPYVGWATIIMTEKPIIKVCNSFNLCFSEVYHIKIISAAMKNDADIENLQYVLISVLGLLAITSND
ncbi:UNVERIFIED_CONTAM: Signal peptidase complex catalytic subunit SEC11C [Sesamum indicum]